VVIVVVNAALLLRLLGGHELMASFMAACMGWALGLRFASLRFARHAETNGLSRE